MAWRARNLLQWSIADAVETTALSTTTGTYTTYPGGLVLWPGFRQLVIEKANAGLLNIAPDVRFHFAPPEPVIYIDTEAEAVTQLQANCLGRSGKVLSMSHPGYRYITNPRCKFLPGGKNLQRHADAALCANDRPRTALFAVEVKTNTVLPAETNIMRGYHGPHHDAKVRNIVAQATGYCARLGVTYGMLSTVKASWFFYAEQKQPGESFVLHMSEPLRFDATNPTVTEAVYALSIMAIDEMALSTDGFPHGPRHAITYNSMEASVHGAATRFGNSGRSSQPTAAQGSAPASGGGGGGSGGGGSGGIVHSSASLRLGVMLGMGQHAVVWSGYFGKQTAAIKIIIPTLAADPDVAVTSLQQEIAAYRALEKLQGTAIPEYRGTGLFDDDEGHLYHFAALERIEGVSLSEAAANEQHGRAAQRALRAIHDHAYLHGDLLPSNIMLCDEPGKGSTVRLLDLGSCSTAASVEMQRAEELQLTSLFAQKGITLEPLTPPLKKPRRASATAI